MNVFNMYDFLTILKQLGHINNKYWHKDGELHRLDGPAVEYTNGDKSWYVDGKLHRVDGPAIDSFCGTKFWYLYGKLHRPDGPAIEHFDGTQEWYYCGEKIECATTEEFLRIVNLKVFW